MKQWFFENSDKLMLLGLVLAFAWGAAHGQAYSQRVNDMILGSLLTLITGKGIAKFGGPNPPGPVAPA